MVKISDRLKTAASLSREGAVLADVGTDHGYVPIYLLEQKKIKSAIAMDINKGPLERAREHIHLYGMDAYIQTRLSDGVAALEKGEADSILVAGMGGGLVMHILEEGKDICQAAGELILQPQSELCSVREYLAENGYVTEAERMVFEDGKYYPMMRVHYQAEKNEDADKTIKDMENSKEQKKSRYKVECLYGRYLLMEKNPVLHQYLVKERQVFENILDNLFKQPESEKIAVRMEEEALDDKGKRTSQPKVTPIHRTVTKKMPGTGMEVCVIKPTSVEDAREITETLLANRTVVLNLEGLDVDIAQRIIDFTSGSCFAISGNLQKISHYIFIITPASVDISGDFQDIFGGAGSFEMPINNGMS